MTRIAGALMLATVLISVMTGCGRSVEGTARAQAATATLEQSPTATTSSPEPAADDGLCNIPDDVATELNVDKSTGERSMESATTLLDDCAWRGPDFELRIASYEVVAAPFAARLAQEVSADSKEITIGTHQAFVLTQSEEEFEPGCVIVLDMMDNSMVVIREDDTYISRASMCSRVRSAATTIEDALE
ncbi:DUF3558 family protein [Rhodococcus sp. WS3]|uniref:DUF3558 family protein n=1 Tax=Rhodococcus sp. WS3 TaxID=2486271 RepID=UPI00165183E0|nr:DUF3558 family protein [Rhodococcus sp. WS3]